MPFKIQKSGSGYKVAKKDGSKTFSKKPMSKSKAKKQMAAIYANSNESFERRLIQILDGEFDDLLNDEPVANDKDEFGIMNRLLTGKILNPPIQHRRNIKHISIEIPDWDAPTIFVSVDYNKPEPQTYDYPGSPGGYEPTGAYLMGGEELNLDAIYSNGQTRKQFEQAIDDAISYHARYDRDD